MGLTVVRVESQALGRAVQQLVDQRPGESLQALAQLGVGRGEPAQQPVQLRSSERVGPAPEVADHPERAGPGPPRLEPLQLFRHDRFGARHLGAPGGGRLLQAGGEVVQVERSDAGEGAHPGIDVPRHGEVDHDQRRGPSGDRGGRHRRAHHRRRRAGGGQQNVGFAQDRRQVVEGSRIGAELPGQGSRGRQGAVHDHDPPRATTLEGGQHLARDPPGAEDGDPATAEPAGLLAGEVDRGGADAARPSPDRGFSAYSLSRPHGGAEQGGEEGAGRALPSRALAGDRHLSLDLRLAEGHRVESGRDPQEVADRVAALEAAAGVDVAVEPENGAEGREDRRGGFAVGRDGVDLDPVAGGEDGDLLDPASPLASGPRLDRLELGLDLREPLPHRDRRVAVSEAEADEANRIGGQSTNP